MVTLVAVGAAVGAAVVYGAATALQHHAASSSVTRNARGLLRQLSGRPGWVAGLALSVVAFGLHVVALHHGRLALIQPIVVTTVVFAVLFRAVLDRVPPSPSEIGWCLCAGSGTAIFVAALPPGPSPRIGEDHTALLVVIIGAAIAAGAVIGAKRTDLPARQGLLLGTAAGVLYGLTAALITMSSSYTRQTSHHLVLGHWSTWLMPVTGIGAFLLSQQAYAATRLSVSVPTLNIVDVLTAVLVSSVVFKDHLFLSPATLLIELLSLVLASVGIWRLVLESQRLHDLKTLRDITDLEVNNLV